MYHQNFPCKRKVKKKLTQSWTHQTLPCAIQFTVHNHSITTAYSRLTNTHLSNHTHSVAPML